MAIVIHEAMTEAQLFDQLAQRCPLRPIVTDEHYQRACELQVELIAITDRESTIDLYLDMLSLAIHQYEAALYTVDSGAEGSS